jgi:hypothetical protein
MELVTIREALKHQSMTPKECRIQGTCHDQKDSGNADSAVG